MLSERSWRDDKGINAVESLQFTLYLLETRAAAAPAPPAAAVLVTSLLNLSDCSDHMVTCFGEESDVTEQVLQPFSSPGNQTRRTAFYRPDLYAQVLSPSVSLHAF